MNCISTIYSDFLTKRLENEGCGLDSSLTPSSSKIWESVSDIVYLNCILYILISLILYTLVSQNKANVFINKMLICTNIFLLNVYLSVNILFNSEIDYIEDLKNLFYFRFRSYVCLFLTWVLHRYLRGMRF